MILRSRLPSDRTQRGMLVLQQDTGAILWGPVPCLGKADGEIARFHGNLTRDPTQPYGDHPLGTYRVVEIRKNYEDYGPYFFLLQPLEGQALLAEQHGRHGLALHGGPVRAGQLRPTFGCLRLFDTDDAELGRLITVGQVYVCEAMTPSP